MPRKPSTFTTPARSVGRAAVVWHQGRDEVVRDVSVVLHLANGVDVSVSADEDVEVLQEQPPPIVEDHQVVVGE